jgi:hypothetical protein
MTRLAVILAAFTGIAATGGCLRVERSHTLYLSPSGVVTWTVHQRDVHSDEQSAAARAAEESAFVLAVTNRTGDAVTGLDAIGGRSVTAELIRDQRPYEAATSGRFDGIDTLLTSMMRELGVRGGATLTSGDGRTTLTVHWTEAELPEPETAAVALLDEPEAYRIVLTEGRFVASEGCVISGDGRIATLAPRPVAADGEQRVSLTWIAR